MKVLFYLLIICNINYITSTTTSTTTSTSTSTTTSTLTLFDNSGSGEELTTIIPTTIMEYIKNNNDNDKNIYIPLISFSIISLVLILIRCFIKNKTKKKYRFVTHKILIDGVINDVTNV